MGPAPAGAQNRGAAGETEVMELALEGTGKEGKKESSKKHALAGSPAEGFLQPVKLSRAELYKEPTNEELTRLRETESLFHSSLLRLQVEELLKEVRLPEKKKERIDAFLREVNQRVLKVPSTPKTELTDQTWLPAGVRVPVHQVPYTVKGCFRFLPPAQVTVVGSYLLGTCIRPDINVDVAVIMPREILQDKDGLNQRYFRKRALYLAHLAHHLGQDPFFGSIRFSYTRGCHLKPSLLLRPHGKDERLVTVRLHPCPPPDFFRPCRLLPSTSNTGEEALAAAVRCYDDLSRLLWGLEGLPLTVSAVQGAHPVLRYTEVFPPTPVRPAYSFYEQFRERASLLPRPDKPCPAYVEPMTVVCHLEGSGQWPQDAEAIRRVRAAFQLRLAELLTQQHGLQCRATATHTDVLKDGFVFRVRVACQREPQILREMRSPEGMISLRDTPASLRLERDTRHLPLLTSALHGLQQQHPAFSGVARLAKRWVRAQLLGEGFTDESLDLLVAALFLHPEPFTPPSSPQVGFLRFLFLVSTFDWKNNPLIVNLNNELTVEEQGEIRSGFLATRTQLPIMVIVTPQDRKNSVWTQDGPSPQVLQQLVVLAAEALPVLEKQLMDPRGPGDIRTVFRPPLDMYDVLIRLSPRHIPRHRQAVDSPAASFCRGLLSEPGPSSLMPVLGYDPPQLYLAQLREAFGDLALFFYDQHGGEVIGVLWKPSSFQPQPFKASNTKGRMVMLQGGELVMVPNVEAILEDLAVLGEGLVQAVVARSERWTV
nr:nucleolar protein 6 [Neomonachus schauinslandi]